MQNTHNMDGTDAKVIEKIDWMERIGKNVEMGSINEEKMAVIQRYEEVLNFLKSVRINNAEDLVLIKKPLDDLESSLKYIPNGPLFNDILPTEIKQDILSYLCESKAFIVASVCQEWKQILEKRFKDKEVVIGEKCSKCEGESNACEKPTDMLKGAAVHNLDVTLVLREPYTENYSDENPKLLTELVIEVDSKLLADALISVSKFTIITDIEKYWDYDVHILSNDQFNYLFQSIEEGDKIMDEVELINCDLRYLNQEKLANCLANKIKKLKLDHGMPLGMLNVETFSTKLQQDSANLKLTHLTLRCFDLSNDSELIFSSNLVKALCNVENIKLHDVILDSSPFIELLIQNILQAERPILMKTLIIDYEAMGYDIAPGELFDFKYLSPEDLKKLFSKMEHLQLDGYFSVEQLDAVRTVPHVEVSGKKFDSGKVFHSIKKGSSKMF